MRQYFFLFVFNSFELFGQNMDKLKRVLSGNDATPEESDGILPYVSVKKCTPRYRARYFYKHFLYITSCDTMVFYLASLLTKYPQQNIASYITKKTFYLVFSSTQFTLLVNT